MLGFGVVRSFCLLHFEFYIVAFKERINQDLKKALNEKDELKTSVLRLLKAAILNKEKVERVKLSKTEELEKLEELNQLTDEETLEVIVSEIKKRKESIEQYKKGDRADLPCPWRRKVQGLIEQEKKELEILQSYLPEPMSQDEIRQLARKAIKRLGASSPRDMGQVMGLLMPQLKGRAEGGLVSKIVQEELSQ